MLTQRNYERIWHFKVLARMTLRATVLMHHGYFIQCILYSSHFIPFFLLICLSGYPWVRRINSYFSAGVIADCNPIAPVPRVKEKLWWLENAQNLICKKPHSLLPCQHLVSFSSWLLIAVLTFFPPFWH